MMEAMNTAKATSPRMIAERRAFARRSLISSGVICALTQCSIPRATISFDGGGSQL